MRVEGGKTITTDGPFVDTKEALNGFLIFEADDLDAAIELAAQIPAARLGGGDRGAPDHGVVARWSGASSRPSVTSGAACSRRMIGFLGDFDLAEEAAQEAFAIAAEALADATDIPPTRGPGS